MTTISSTVTIGQQNRVQAEFKSGLDDFTKDLMVQQKEWLAAKLAYDGEAQRASQNAQPIHTTFRLNGKLVGMIGVNSGFTGTGISDGGAYLRAIEVAKQTGLTGEAATDYASEQVSQALKDRYGVNIEVEVFEPGNRPTTGEMHTEMFGEATSLYEGMSSDWMAYIKHFAQTYAQTFGEDPFAGLDVPYDDQ
ncbi:hypothetical protein [Thalassospira sp.]|uniref:hypothetical protein n=1 Tax=Thalassospira sp. TaxID=1912094 RepID=UPI0027356B91|nr:hypothetical protein [Thalassospira sp.]MDP2697067.1 hypothetical protein [Thalassospira sp.]